MDALWQGLPLVHGLDAWLCCSLHLFFFFNLLTQQTLLHIVFLHHSVWKGTDKVLNGNATVEKHFTLGEYSNTLSRFILLRPWWNRAVWAPLATVQLYYQPHSQGPLSSSFEKVPRLQLVTCQCVQIITAQWVGPRLVKSKIQLYPWGGEPLFFT